MKTTKLFKVSDDLSTSLMDDLGSLSTYHFSILFTKGSHCSLHSLLMKFSTQSHWTPVITHPASDNDGEITFELGKFFPGTSIDITFSVGAISDIPAVKAMITNAKTGVSQKLAPSGDTNKQINQSDTWNQNILNRKLH